MILIFLLSHTIQYNGYNQGLTALKSLIDSKHPDIKCFRSTGSLPVTYINLVTTLLITPRLVVLQWIMLYLQGHERTAVRWVDALIKQESHAVAGKPRDAAVNSDRYQQPVGQKQSE